MLRKCKDCGLEAHTEDALVLFKKNKSGKHGRENLCKPCRAKQAYKWQVEHPEYHKQYYAENREQHSEAVRSWCKNNPGKRNAITAKRRAAKAQATPQWYDIEKKRIEFLYTTAQLSGLHVDHIVPLQNDLVCGLHTLSNLQLLMPSDNMSKGNSFAA